MCNIIMFIVTTIRSGQTLIYLPFPNTSSEILFSKVEFLKDKNVQKVGRIKIKNNI